MSCKKSITLPNLVLLVNATLEEEAAIGEELGIMGCRKLGLPAVGYEMGKRVVTSSALASVFLSKMDGDAPKGKRGRKKMMETKLGRYLYWKGRLAGQKRWEESRASAIPAVWTSSICQQHSGQLYGTE
ncbi:hypothetical protein PAXINDRAFT_12435 [Paxillus involutus ATCC 200175]|uniref:Uncharacterized protein n=1 Tax=Paxillus involutus ATCC 200175 TaxID=664439 RepID=A0A0C9TGL5_PAXIN|nr:hypothetical protein PAXINDRAFT_12435 [Paxillus involutus ATCC 200175]